MYFAKDSSNILYKIRDDGTPRAVTSDDPCYLAWLDQGGVLGEMPAVPGPTLAEIKGAACARIEAERLSLETAGVWINWPDGTRSKIQTRDERDWRNINGVASRGLARLTQGQTDEDWFRDADNIDHTLPLPLQAMALGYQAAAAVSAIAKVAQKAKDTINAPDVTTAEQVAAIEAAVIWP